MSDADLQKVEAALDTLLADHDPTTESYRDSNGRRRTRRKRHVRWEHASGVVDHFFPRRLRIAEEE